MSVKLKGILTKPKISLVDEEFILMTVFESLADLGNLVSNDKLRDYLTHNPQVSQHFHITKKELAGDLMVYETAVKGHLSYKEYFELMKSIQITFRSLNPGKLYKTKGAAKKEFPRDIGSSKKEGPEDYKKYLS